MCVCVCVCVCVSPASIDSHSFSEGEGGHDLEAGSGEEGGGIGPEDSMESVVSIKDLLDRKKGELSDVESKYKDVKEGKVSIRFLFLFATLVFAMRGHHPQNRTHYIGTPNLRAQPILGETKQDRAEESRKTSSSRHSGQCPDARESRIRTVGPESDSQVCVCVSVSLHACVRVRSLT